MSRKTVAKSARRPKPSKKTAVPSTMRSSGVRSRRREPRTVEEAKALYEQLAKEAADARIAKLAAEMARERERDDAVLRVTGYDDPATVGDWIVSIVGDHSESAESFYFAALRQMENELTVLDQYLRSTGCTSATQTSAISSRRLADALWHAADMIRGIRHRARAVSVFGIKANWPTANEASP